MLKKVKNWLVLASLGLALTACGGGGGGGDTPPANNSNSTWDQMVWDQDNWN